MPPLSTDLSEAQKGWTLFSYFGLRVSDACSLLFLREAVIADPFIRVFFRILSCRQEENQRILLEVEIMIGMPSLEAVPKVAAGEGDRRAETRPPTW